MAINLPGSHYARFLLDVPKLAPWARFSPGRLLGLQARRRPHDLALAYQDARYTWAQLDGEAERYARFFASEGVGRGDVVAVFMDNRPDYLFAVMGLAKLGAVAALINTNLVGKALAHAVRVAAAKKIFVGAEHAATIARVIDQLDGIRTEHDLYIHVDQGAEPDADPSGAIINDRLATAPPLPAGAPACDALRGSDTFCYIYTSGTTGLPKAAIIRNQRFLGAAIVFGRLMHRSRPGDVVYVALPLYHGNGFMLGWGAVLATGAALALRRRFSVSSFWDDIRAFRATSFMYIGELCRYLLNAPPAASDRDHRLRVAVGNGLRADIWETFQRRFGVPVIREFYGSTEGNVPALNVAGKPGMIGRLPRGQAVVRCDAATGTLRRGAAGRCERAAPGEVGLLIGRISSLASFDGYVDREATQSKILGDVFKDGDRYFNTGDLVQVHPGRWLSFADRLGDTFRWKGENVSTSEVSEILCGAPGVLEANVYGVSIPGADGRGGMAALSVSDDFDLERFGAHARAHLAVYQRPLFLRVLGENMRVTATLKQQKVDYRDEGYDPARIDDHLYVLDGGSYRDLDAQRYERIVSGAAVPG